MLVRERAKKRGPRKAVERTPDRKRLAKSAKSVKVMKSYKKKMENTGLNEVQAFKQRVNPTRTLDRSYDRVGSVSPLKYRPKIDMDGSIMPEVGVTGRNSCSPARSLS